MAPFFSICIPAYNRTAYLKRLLQSVASQSFRDFEVVVTDDSDNNNVALLCESFAGRFPISYYKNEKPLGTPENWNEGIRKANGQWIKIMHDDDWFADNRALEQFAKIAVNIHHGFIFSAYTNVETHTNKEKPVFPEKFRLKELRKQPAILLAKNFIGPPSVTLHKNDQMHFYDPQLKWLVDIDMYRRRLETDSVVYIPHSLIKVGISDSQVTSYTKNVGSVEIPEHFHFLKKMGIVKLKNVLVYDYWWRFIRNFGIRSEADFANFGYQGNIHPVLKSIIDMQNKIPEGLLRKGVFSKLFMFMHFISNRSKIK